MRSGNSVQYVGSDGKMATLALASTAYPSGFAVTTQNGFDVFTLAGVTYQVRPMQRSGKTWGSDFIISDLSGKNVIFNTQYADQYVSLNQKTGNGCNLVARKVSDYKVELYQIYTTTEATPVGFAAMYEITIPEPGPLYIAGDDMGWESVENGEPARFEFDMKRMKYVYKGFKGGNFKISTAKGSWGAFNGAAWYPTTGNNLEPNKTYTFTKPGYDNGDISIVEGDYTIEMSADLTEMTIIGEETYTQRGVYIVGELNGWTFPGDKFTYEDGYFVYNGFTGGEFKLSVGENANWTSFNANIIYTTDGTTKLMPNREYAIAKMNNQDAANFIVPAGEYTIKIDEKLTSIVVSGQEIVEEKDVYLVGAVNGWKLPGTLLEFDGENYVFSNFTGGEFKLAYGSTENWDVFNANTIYTSDNVLALEHNKAYAIEKKQMDGAPSFNMPDGEYTVMIDKQFWYLTVSGQPNVYIVDDVNNWTLPGTKLKFDGTNYVYSTYTGGGFKIAVGNSGAGDENWPKFNANALYPTDGTFVLEPNKAYPVSKTGNTDKNISAPYGEYTLQIDKAITTLTASGHEKFVIQDMYLIGEFNNWAEPGVPFQYNAEPVDGKVVYTIENLDRLSGEFLVAAAGYNPKYAGATFTGPSTQTLKRGHDINNKCNAGLSEVNLTFTVAVDDPKNATLTIESNSHYAIDGRKPYAYNMSINWLQWDVIDVTFNASAPAEGGEVVFIDSTGKEYVKSFGAVDGGVNTIRLDNYSDGLPSGEDYTWAVRLKGNSEGTTPKKVSDMSIPATASQYTGIAVIKDPESPAYGYTVIGMSAQHGYMVFDQSGELQYGGPIHAAWQTANFKNGNSNTIFGDSYMGYAVFANWNDPASGYWAVDPLDPNKEPYNMLEPKGYSRNEKTGLISFGGQDIGGGGTSISFLNLGAETLVVCFDEDYGSGNHVQVRKIKTGDSYITTPPTFSIGKCNSEFADVATCTKGYFVAQYRAAANDADNPVLRFYDLDNNLLYNTADAGCALVNCTGSVACNRDGSLLALTDNDDGTTHIYKVTYTPKNTSIMRAPGDAGAPTFEKIGTVQTNSVKSSRIALAFDAANNLHVADRKNSKYQVYTMPGETSSFTAAPSDLKFHFVTGVEDVTVDDTVEEAEPEYYTLQGIRVDGNNLTPGFYIRRQGNTSTKIYIK